MGYIAHIRQSDEQIQSVEAHLLGVKALAESFGEKIGVKYIAGLAGLLHDMGKYTDEFRNYIIEAVRNPDNPPKRGSVDHATAGGKLLYEMYHTGRPAEFYGLLAEVVGNAIISHHAYLHDFLDPNLESGYLRRVQKGEPELKEFEKSKMRFFDTVMCEEEFQQYVSQAVEELETYLRKPFTGNVESKLMFLTKFIFSALIDADRTNTRWFEENIADEPEINRKELFDAYYEKLMRKIVWLQEQDTAKTHIKQLRKEMSEQCDKFSARPSGIFTLSIPTGGGKTLASLRYALRHASLYGKKRIIYVIPYTTIIEQNAKEVRDIIQDDVHILEHHSNVIDDTDDDDEQEDGVVNVHQKLKLAKDNWDSPIIFTTMVQFLNAFYAKGSRNIRRLHNLSESVIIFDEVQKVPVYCISLFNQALNFLHIYGQSSLILCTATQPALDFVGHRLAISADAEIVEELDDVIESFKRVEIVDQATDETFDNAKLAEFIEEKIREVRSVLVVLNTKAVVRQLYLLVKELPAVPVYHLSTSMCAAHRQEILAKVRGHLHNHEQVVCISTQLIEAGVDVSFDCVIRSLAGLDSIAQAAGRCNRHGEQAVRQVYVIDHAEEKLEHLQEIKVGKKLARRMLIDLKRDLTLHGGHLLSVQAMNKFFKDFYSEFHTRLDYYIPTLRKHMTELLTSSKQSSSYHQAYKQRMGKNLPLFIVNSYKTAAENFHAIDDHTTTVLAPFGDAGKHIIAQLNGDESIEKFTALMRQAQHYSVNLYAQELRELTRNDGLVRLFNGKVLALKESAYNEEFGLDTENESSFGQTIF
ncbi:CRISPR-associated helicase Cas3' [Alicyclobacillus suci]|uniref:CRISPR-associated helicase Cas3' n=1 Tax=Alicyclobacillus suci TaxID=2816080 RepID=UPI001A8FF29F|nr:CRISPR-associated helicase Cas3' [Alicyclobacillus suci]